MRTFARYVANGLLPNNFPDSAGVIPGYNTADATLWYVLAIRAYEEATGDDSLVTDLLPALLEIIERHLEGPATASASTPPMGCFVPASQGCSSLGWTPRWATGW